MTFQEVVENEAKFPYLKYHRVDEKEWGWYIQFQKHTGRLVTIGKKNLLRRDIDVCEIYHHDLFDGEWEVYKK